MKHNFLKLIFVGSIVLVSTAFAEPVSAPAMTVDAEPGSSTEVQTSLIHCTHGVGRGTQTVDLEMAYNTRTHTTTGKLKIYTFPVPANHLCAGNGDGAKFILSCQPQDYKADPFRIEIYKQNGTVKYYDVNTDQLVEDCVES